MRELFEGGVYFIRLSQRFSVGITQGREEFKEIWCGTIYVVWWMPHLTNKMCHHLWRLAKYYVAPLITLRL